MASSSAPQPKRPKLEEQQRRVTRSVFTNFRGDYSIPQDQLERLSLMEKTLANHLVSVTLKYSYYDKLLRYQNALNKS